MCRRPNLFFPSGVVLAERNLYLAVALPAVVVGLSATWLASRRGLRPAAVAAAIVVISCGWRSYARLPAWRDNRSQLVTVLAEHPESYRAHASAARVLAGIGDTRGHGANIAQPIRSSPETVTSMARTQSS